MWFTGLSGAGKTTLAQLVAAELRAKGRRVEVLDGDEVRHVLSSDLGFSRADRDTNIRRIIWLCELLTRNGIDAIVAAVSPYRSTRAEARERLERFVEVFVDAPIDALAIRDTKGLYRRSREGTMRGLTGVDDPYEPPIDAEAVCHSDGRETPQESAQRVVEVIESLGYA